ncbi:hypothetical protein E3P84_01765 [Wallemia ichthyophaga]|nr:hypothetical protein E3P84_01765 [Wallemia ichthyophaga]TIB41745.1 hypothetical protein E3P83_01709 [Wallemia ichthyophaga]
MGSDERQRLKNIEENNRLLEQLGLGEASKEVFGKRSHDSDDAKPRQQKQQKQQPAKKRVKREEDADKAVAADPPRRSSRRVPTTEEDKKASREQLETELEREAQRKDEKRRIEHETRRNDMPILELLKRDPVEYIHSKKCGESVKKEEKAKKENDEDEDDEEDDDENDELIAKELSGYLASRPAIPRPIHSVEDEKDTNSSDSVHKYKERANSLVFKTIQKVTSNRIHSMQYHPDKESDLVFAGDKYGQLGILKYDADKDTAQIWRLQPHVIGSPISCIRFDASDSRKAFTTSYDCTIRQLDFESGLSTQLFRSNDGYEQETNRLITHLDIPHQTPSLLHAADNGGGLSLKDMRESRDRGVRYVLSKNKLGSVSINPSNEQQVCVASNDHAVRIFDMRMVKKHCNTLEPITEDEDDLPYYDNREEIGMLHRTIHGKAVTSAYYSPTGSNILSTSFDNTVKVFDDKLNVVNSIKHNNETGRWLSVFRMQWINPAPWTGVPTSFITPSMKRSLEMWTMGDRAPSADLVDTENITAVPAVVSAKPFTGLDDLSIAGGNGSGKVVLFM